MLSLICPKARSWLIKQTWRRKCCVNISFHSVLSDVRYNLRRFFNYKPVSPLFPDGMKLRLFVLASQILSFVFYCWILYKIFFFTAPSLPSGKESELPSSVWRIHRLNSHCIRYWYWCNVNVAADMKFRLLMETHSPWGRWPAEVFVGFLRVAGPPMRQGSAFCVRWDWSSTPEHRYYTLTRHYEQGSRPSSFLFALFTTNFMHIVMTAHEINVWWTMIYKYDEIFSI